jgi:hypothetical protein
VKLHALLAVVALALCASSAAAQTVEPSPEPAPAPAPAPSKFRSPDDGWLDVSGFLDEKYGFLPVVIGGVGFRYEIARKYGIHMGLDLAFGPDNTAVYVQVGSAWARP